MFTITISDSYAVGLTEILVSGFQGGKAAAVSISSFLLGKMF
jgi:hypothetical protein